MPSIYKPLATARDVYFGIGHYNRGHALKSYSNELFYFN